jgi:hypothetical protein
VRIKCNQLTSVAAFVDDGSKLAARHDTRTRSKRPERRSNRLCVLRRQKLGQKGAVTVPVTVAVAVVVRSGSGSVDADECDYRRVGASLVHSV